MKIGRKIKGSKKYKRKLTNVKAHKRHVYVRKAKKTSKKKKAKRKRGRRK